MRASPLLLASTLSLVALAAASGCAPGITSPLTQGVVEGGIKSMDDRANQQRIAHVLASPEVRAAEEQLIAQILDGSLKSLTENQRAERLGQISGRFAGSLIRSMSKDTSAAVRSVMDETMSSAMSEARQKDMARMVGAVVQATVRSAVDGVADADMGPRLSAALTNVLGPAIQRVMNENLGAGMADTLAREDVKRALGSTARLLGHELVVGVEEGLDERKHTTPQGGLVSNVSSLASQGATVGHIIVWVLLVALVIAVAALMHWVWVLVGRMRESQGDARLHEETTRVLAEAIRAAEGKPWSAELLESLEERFKDDDDAMLRIRAARGGRPPPSEAPRAPVSAPRISHH
jgi:hypothetical protein